MRPSKPGTRCNASASRPIRTNPAHAHPRPGVEYHRTSPNCDCRKPPDSRKLEALKETHHDCPGTGSQPTHGLCRGAPAAPRVHHRRAPAARAAGQPERRRSAARLLGQHRRLAQVAHQLHQGQHAPGRRQRRRGHATHAGLPARDPARHHARAKHGQRQEGSHRRQRAGGDLWRKGFARRVLPAPAGRDAAGRGQLHRPRHPQERPA